MGTLKDQKMARNRAIARSTARQPSKFGLGVWQRERIESTRCSGHDAGVIALALIVLLLLRRQRALCKERGRSPGVSMPPPG